MDTFRIKSDVPLALLLIVQSDRNPGVFCQESVMNASFIETKKKQTNKSDGYKMRNMLKRTVAATPADGCYNNPGQNLND